MKMISPLKGSKILLLAGMLALSVQGISQTPQSTVLQEWTTTAGSQNFFQNSVTKIDGSGNVLIAGATMNSSGNYDALVAKYSSGGTLLWINQYAGSGNKDDFASALFLDASGNVYITGAVTNTVGDSSNVLTVKYNSSGTQQWASTYHGGTGTDFGTGLIVDASGNVFVTGASNRGSTNKFDVVALKYNSSGAQQWVSFYNYNNLNDGGYKIVFSGSKIAIGAGVQNNSTDYKMAALVYNASTGALGSSSVSSSSGIGFAMVYGITSDANKNIYITGSKSNTGVGLDYYTVKYDSNLVVLWTATYNGSSSLNDEAKGIVIDGSSNVYVTGYSTTSTQGKNMVTIKYNSSGSQQWTKTYNGNPSKDDEAYAIAIDGGGNPVVCGATNNGVSYDYYTVKYDPSSNIKWEMSWNSAANRSDRAMDVAVDQSGAVIVTGQSMTGPTTYAYVTVKYADHSVLTPTDSEPLHHAFFFTANRGQILDTDAKDVPEIKYYNKENAGKQMLYFTDDRISYVYVKPDTASTSPVDTLERIDQTWTNSSTDKVIYSMNERENYTSYFLGQHTDAYARIKNYNTLFHEEVYDGIDVMYSNNSRGLKYYYIIARGASTDPLMEHYEGYNSMYVDGNGDLVIEGVYGTMRRPQPKVWEITSSGSTVSLAWQPTYNVSGDDVTFTFGSYNTANTLIVQIDFGSGPSIAQPNPNDNLDWATHYGSVASGTGIIYDTETDADGESYFSGFTYATNFPATNGLFQTAGGGSSDGIIMKFKADASLKWATYMGGSSQDAKYHIDVDTTGNVYFGGRSMGMQPVNLPGAYNDNTNNGLFDWHLGKLDTSGTVLLWSTYYGASGNDFLMDIKVTPLADRLYVIGTTSGTGFPIRNKTGAYNAGTGSSVIAEFDSALDTTWSVRFGTGAAMVQAIDGDMNDGFFITGSAGASGSTVPYVNPLGGAYYDNAPANSSDEMFVCRLNTVDTVTWGTLFGGTYYDAGRDIVKTGKDIYIVGETSSQISNSFPIMGNVSAGEYKDSIVNTNNPDAFIAKFSVGGIQKWTTYFGGVGADNGYGITADKSRTVYVTGNTASWDYDTMSYGAAYMQSPNLAAGEVFFAAFSPTNALLWSTGFGGVHYEGSAELATYGNEWLYFGGHSMSAATTFPWDYPTGGYVDTNKTNTTDGTPYVGRFGIQNINVSTPSIEQPKFGLQLFPNPTDGTAGLLITGLYSDDIEIVITDMLGRVVSTRKIDGVFGTLYEPIETTLWESGVYVVTVKTSRHGTVTKKLIKQ